MADSGRPAPTPLLRVVPLADGVALEVAEEGATAAATPPPRRRRFAAYRLAGAPLPLLGHAVLDEFGTLSSPILLGARSAAGRLYDHGLRRSFARDPELGLDAGWPPLVVGLDGATDGVSARLRLHNAWAGAHRLSAVHLRGACVVATDAPLLPRQLQGLADAACIALVARDPARSAVAVAIATGNALASLPDDALQEVVFAGEATVDELVRAVAGLVGALVAQDDAPGTVELARSERDEAAT